MNVVHYFHVLLLVSYSFKSGLNDFCFNFEHREFYSPFTICDVIPFYDKKCLSLPNSSRRKKSLNKCPNERDFVTGKIEGKSTSC